MKLLPVDSPVSGSLVELEAIHLRGRRYAVRPVGQLGTCGSWPCLWAVQYVAAKSPADAIAKAKPIRIP